MIDQKAKEYTEKWVEAVKFEKIPAWAVKDVEQAYRAGWRDGQAEFYKRERVDEGLNHSLRGMT